MTDTVSSTGLRRVVAAIATLVIVTLFLTVILVRLPLSSRNAFDLDLWPRFFPSLELLATALVIAIPIGFALAAVKACAGSRVLLGIIDAALLALRCIPFFVLALELSAFAGLQLGYFENRSPWSSNLIVPAVVLALFALPGFARFDFFVKEAPRRIIASGCRCLAERFPQIIAAQLLVEIFFAWPGEGHAFMTAIEIGRPGLAVPIVFFIAVVAVLLRLLASTLTADNGDTTLA